MNRTPLLAAALAWIALPAMAAPPVMENDGILTDSKGMTLYTFDNDKDGQSACYDACATNWPPLLAEAGAMAEGEYGLVARTDGTMQWTHEGKPLYLWAKDAKPGDKTGDGIKGVWHVAKE